MNILEGLFRSKHYLTLYYTLRNIGEIIADIELKEGFEKEE